jgi:hypothetical protein
MNASIATEGSYSIILVNYKSLELTQTCLNLLHEGLRGSDVPIYVVDNDSNDASTDYLRTLDWIQLIERKPWKPARGSERLSAGREKAYQGGSTIIIDRRFSN